MRLTRKGQNKSGNILGIDFDAEAVHIVEINYKGELIQQLTVSLPGDCITDGQITNSELVVETLANNLTAFNSQQALIALPSNLISSKKITLEAELNADDIEESLGFEAERILNTENCAVDYWSLESDKADQQDYQLVCCANDIVQQRLAVLQQLSLQVSQLTVNAYALANCFLTPQQAMIYFHQQQAELIIQLTDKTLLTETTDRQHDVATTINALLDMVHVENQNLELEKLFLVGDFDTDTINTAALSEQRQLNITTLSLPDITAQQTLAWALAAEAKQ